MRRGLSQEESRSMVGTQWLFLYDDASNQLFAISNKDWKGGCGLLWQPLGLWLDIKMTFSTMRVVKKKEKLVVLREIVTLPFRKSPSKKKKREKHQHNFTIVCSHFIYFWSKLVRWSKWPFTAPLNFVVQGTGINKFDVFMNCHHT